MSRLSGDYGIDDTKAFDLAEQRVECPRRLENEVEAAEGRD